MRLFLTLVLTSLLIGCSTTDKQLAFNRFTIEAGYGGDSGYFEAVDELTKKAERLCDGEFRKLHDYDTGTAQDKLLVWEVACKDADRQDQVYTKKVGTN